MGATASTSNPFPQNYTVLEQRHHSGNISTYKVRDENTSKEMMMKMIFIRDYSEEDVVRYKNGIINVCKLKIKNIVESVFVPSNAENLVIIMPLYSKSLTSINPSSELNESNRLDILLRLANSLNILHENSLIHGNIKPSNVLISDDDEYLLSDYCENILNKGKYDNNDINYKSIEAIECKEVDISSDVWSFGCLIYYLYTGNAPFKGNDIFEIGNNIKMHLFEERDPEKERMNNYPYMKAILNKIFVKKEGRLSMSETIDRINKIPRNKVSIHSNEGDDDDDDDEENEMAIVIPTAMGLDRKIRKKLDEMISKCKNDLKMEEVTYGDERLRYLCQYFPQFVSLESLILNSDGISDRSINDLSMKLEFIPHLKKLEISNNRISDEGMCLISKKLSNITELCELNISKNKIKNKGITELSNNLTLIQNLNVLNISDNCINDDGLIELSKNLKYVNKLKLFNCNNNNINDKGFSYFSNHLKDITELRNLEFNNNKLNEISIEEFSKNMSNIKNLTKLSLSSNNVSDLGLKCISDNLMFVSELKVLELSNNNINNIGIINFSNEMKNICNLTYIDLSNNNISDDGFNIFCNSLSSFSKLAQLNIGYNKMGNVGLDSLGDNLKYLRELVCLFLDGNEFSDDGLLVLCENFHYCDKLQYLFLRNSGIHESTIGKIQSYKHLSVNYRL